MFYRQERNVKINDRDITQKELQEIYADFKNIEIQDGIRQSEQVRYQYVAEENDNVIGFASGLTNHKWFYLTDLWVREDYRRQGLGTKLLLMLENKIKSAGIEHIWTWTTGIVNPAFYKKQGYEVFAIFEDFSGKKGFHQTGFRKDLV